jgi:group II intron reverse transcriptase/maturase
MELSRIAELAKQEAGRKFCSIAHLLTTELLGAAFVSLRKDAAAGVDGVTYADYEEHGVENLVHLQERLKSKTYRAQPLRRIYIDKEDGRKRPISIPSLEDKIVQRATVGLLNPIFEQDFLDCSYGFRPGRSAHDALDEVGRLICLRPTAYVLELDICSYFDSIVRQQLMEMVEGRISDASIIRLVRKWINVGVVDDGRLLESEAGTGQGQIISPLLANIYLHHVLDRWFEDDVKPRLKGFAAEIRYADDAILCFANREDAQRVFDVLPKRFAKYGLTLHPQKTRLIEFGRRAYGQAQRTQTKPATFDFLGFTHLMATSRKGQFVVHVRTMKKRLKRGLKAIAAWCCAHCHAPLDYQQQILNAKLRGHFQYYGRPSNYRSLAKFVHAVSRIWRRWLSRRTRGRSLSWPRFVKLLARYPLLRPRITRPWTTSVNRI